MMKYLLVELCFMLFFCHSDSFNLKTFAFNHLYNKTRSAKNLDQHKSASLEEYLDLSKLDDEDIEATHQELKLGMPVDHFDITNKKRWSMRYFQDSTFWKPNSTVYVLLMGNTALNSNVFSKGFMSEMAKETGGVMFAPEHRYYGKSIPDAELKFLTSEQALADLNAMLQYVKKIPDYKNCKVVLVGGGYGGSLAVWMKVMYPDAVDVVVASGAPLLAKVDFDKYHIQVALDFEMYAPAKCLKVIKAKFELYNALIDMNKTHIFNALQIENDILCENIDMSKRENQMSFFFFHNLKFGRSAEGGLPGINATCEDTLTRYPNITCTSFSLKIMLDSIMQLSESDPEIRDTKHQAYQSCTEFGFFETTSALVPPLDKNVPLEFYYKMCSDLFGSQFSESKLNEAVKLTNERYGGLRPRVKNVIFVHGELDPWQSLTVTDNYSEDNFVVKIKGESHCTDLYPADYNDSEELISARKEIIQAVKRLLGLKISVEKSN